MSINKSNDVNHELTEAEKKEGKGFDPKLEVIELEDCALDKVTGGGE